MSIYMLLLPKPRVKRGGRPPSSELGAGLLTDPTPKYGQNKPHSRGTGSQRQ